MRRILHAKSSLERLRLAISLGVIVSLGLAGQVFAQAASSSSSYGVTEVQFGAGSSLNDCSASYCAKTSAGDLAAGRAASDNYSAQVGFNTSDEPMLEVITEVNNQDLGVLDTATTATAQASVKVRTYLSSGYVMQITGHTPNMGARYLEPLLGATAAEPGTEQFGINLVDNSTPDVGAAPVQVPSGEFSYGAVADGYNTPNEFKYLSGDVVAQSDSSTGETDYTISMIVNISNLTPGGKYTGSFSAVVTPTF
jgi:hypothetical protein